MPFLFVSGTGTGVGKTFSTAVLVRYLADQGHDVLPVKLVQTGELPGEGDIFNIERLTGIAGEEFARFKDPLAPNLAARREGVEPIQFDQIISWLLGFDDPDRIIVVEGAGGLLVRLGEDFTLADVASALNAPLVIVTSTGLGSLNAAELSVEAANCRGLKVLGVLGGSIPQNPDLATMLNLEEFERVTGVPFWGALPEGLSRVEGFVEKQSFPALDAFKKPPAR